MVTIYDVGSRANVSIDQDFGFVQIHAETKAKKECHSQYV